MKRYLALALATVTIASATLTAQSTAGWKQRIDASTDASDPDPAGEVKFTAIPGGFQTSNPKAAVFYNPANTATGNYTLKGTFAQNARSSHANFIGLVFGGKDLAGAGENYTYFLIAPQNGSFLVKQRTGAGQRDTKDVVARTPNAAITQLDANGKASNTLEVRVGADKIDYVVNGTVVSSSPKTGITTDGIWGFRVNHALPDVSVTGLAVTK
jgi:predicted secreted protein